MRELFALTIDRATSAEVARLNKQIGKSIHMTARQRAFFNPTCDPDSSYELLLHEYVRLKLVLHHTRRSMYVDWYTEREDIDLLKARERCTELRELIRAKRRTIRFAAWGDLTPWEPTPY